MSLHPSLRVEENHIIETTMDKLAWVSLHKAMKIMPASAPNQPISKRMVNDGPSKTRNGSAVKLETFVNPILRAIFMPPSERFTKQ